MGLEIAIKAAWVAAGLAIMWLAWSLGIGKLDEPGPGLMSIGLGALIAIIGAAQLSAQLLSRTSATTEPLSRSAVLRVGGVVLLMAIYIFAFEQVGFVITTFVLLTVLFGGLAGMRWGWSVLLAAVLTLGNYGVFKLLLGTQLPAGILG